MLFRTADLVLLTKADLLSHLENFDQDRAERNIHNLPSQAPVIPVSAQGHEFFGFWINWLINIHEARKDGEDLRPKIHTDGLVLHAAE